MPPRSARAILGIKKLRKAVAWMAGLTALEASASLFTVVSYGGFMTSVAVLFWELSVTHRGIVVPLSSLSSRSGISR